jgi:hypothetical protein
VSIDQLRHIRWAVRATLLLGVAASVTANVLHARDNPISQMIAGWPPVALLIIIELIPRVPIARGWWAGCRLCAAALIAGIAAWVSYWHMAGVAARYGEQGSSPYLLPLSVDGLIVVASICLVELGGRIRDIEGINQGGSDGEAQREGHTPPGSGDGSGEAGRQEDGKRELPADPVERSSGVGAEEGHEGPGVHREVPEVAAQGGVKLTPVRKRPPTSEAKVVRAHEKNPAASNADLARQLKLSPATVKRHRPPKQVNGQVPELVHTGEEV